MNFIRNSSFVWITLRNIILIDKFGFSSLISSIRLLLHNRNLYEFHHEYFYHTSGNKILIFRMIAIFFWLLGIANFFGIPRFFFIDSFINHIYCNMICQSKFKIPFSLIVITSFYLEKLLCIKLMSFNFRLGTIAYF